MTLFRQYFRAQLSGFWIWLAAGGGLVLLLAKSAPVDSAGAQAMAELIAKMPESVKMMFGLVEGLNAADGFMAMKMAPGMALILCMYAVLTALGIVTREVDRRTIDFLLGMPVDRRQVLLARAGVVTVNVGVMAVVDWVIVRLVFGLGGVEASFGRYAELLLVQWLMATALAYLTLLSSLWIDDYSFGVKLWLGVVAGSYFLDLVLRAAGLTHWQRFFSPFGYGDPATVILKGLPVADVVVLALVSVAALAASVPVFERKQITA
jgi:ABC-type transport system involved in multi-copper enzyme maturation permease subunit